MITVLLVGLAAATLSTTASGLFQAGVSREQLIALNAAEYGVARAKALIASQSPAVFNSTTGWTPLLTSVTLASYLCTPNTAAATTPGIAAAAANIGNLFVDSSNAVQSGAPTATWNFCIHNNAEDPHFLDTANNTPVNIANGNSNDTRDPQHLLVIEGYGTGPNNSAARVTVTVGPPTLAGTPAPGDCYSQEGGSGTHSGQGCN